jgi:sugar/nucleoside kinase (ribokinase family)
MLQDCLSVGILVADHLCAPIERLPEAGELVLAERLELQVGGCASNAAVDMARLGLHVGVVGCVGQDVFGDFIADALRAAGVDTNTIRRLPDVGTSGTLIVNVVGQDRRFIHAVGANAHLTAADVPLERLRQVKVLYVGGYRLMPALDAGGLGELFREARRAGAMTVLDVVFPNEGDHWSHVAPVLAETDVFLPNHDEARMLTGCADPREQCARFADAGAGTVVITRGGEGTYLWSPQERWRADVYAVPYAGATGAGDAFDAGYIAGLVWGLDRRGCLTWGSALGASCVRSISATQSVFTRAEAETFIAREPLKIEPW